MKTMYTFFAKFFKNIANFIRYLVDYISSLVISIKSKFTNTSNSISDNSNSDNTNNNSTNNNFNNNNAIKSNVVNNPRKRVSRGPGRPPLIVEVYDRETGAHLATFYSVVIAEAILHIRHNSIKRAIESNSSYKDYVFEYRR